MLSAITESEMMAVTRWQHYSRILMNYVKWRHFRMALENCSKLHRALLTPTIVEVAEVKR